MKEHIQEKPTRLEYSIEIVREVNVDLVKEDDITTLPTVDLCGQRLIGYQEENDLASGILNAVVKSCFK